MTLEPAFWEQKDLTQMSREEWESLCDGCGYCCLVKLEDEDSGHIYTTNVACRLLDTATCRCLDYPNRQTQVKNCLVLTTDKPAQFELLPASCAYRLCYEGKALPQWHPLISHERDSVRQSGASVCGYAISEDYVHPDQLEDHVIHRLR